MKLKIVVVSVAVVLAARAWALSVGTRDADAASSAYESVIGTDGALVCSQSQGVRVQLPGQSSPVTWPPCSTITAVPSDFCTNAPNGLACLNSAGQFDPSLIPTLTATGTGSDVGTGTNNYIPKWATFTATNTATSTGTSTATSTTTYTVTNTTTVTQTKIALANSQISEDGTTTRVPEPLYVGAGQKSTFISAPTAAARNDYTGSVGFTFQVSTTTTVLRLGRLYVSGNTGNHVINLWDSGSTGTPIATATVLAASASDANAFKWASITPVILSPGTTYALTIDETSGGDTWKDIWSPGTLSSISSFAAAYGATSTYPTGFGASGQMYDTGALWISGETGTLGEITAWSSTADSSSWAGVFNDPLGRMLVGVRGDGVVYFGSCTTTGAVLQKDASCSQVIDLGSSGVGIGVTPSFGFGALQVGNGSADTRVLAWPNTPYAVRMRNAGSVDIYIGTTTAGDLQVSNNSGSSLVTISQSTADVTAGGGFIGKSIKLNGTVSGVVTHDVAATTATYDMRDPSTAPGASQAVQYPSGGGQGTWFTPLTCGGTCSTGGVAKFASSTTLTNATAGTDYDAAGAGTAAANTAVNGTSGKSTRFTGTHSVGNGAADDDGTNISVNGGAVTSWNGGSSSAVLHPNGSITATSDISSTFGHLTVGSYISGTNIDSAGNVTGYAVGSQISSTTYTDGAITANPTGAWQNLVAHTFTTTGTKFRVHVEVIWADAYPNARACGLSIMANSGGTASTLRNPGQFLVNPLIGAEAYNNVISGAYLLGSKTVDASFTLTAGTVTIAIAGYAAGSYTCPVPSNLATMIVDVYK